MERGGVRIVDTFAEAFDMRAARVLITAQSPGWARTAAQSMTGFATSVIGCKVEAGIEAELPPAGDARRPAGRERAALRLRRRRARQPAGRPSGPDGAHLPDHGLLRRPAPGGRARRRRRTAAPFRRPLPVEQVPRRPALLADSGDGGRVPGAGGLRRPEGHRRRQLPDPGARIRTPRSRRRKRRSTPCARSAASCSRSPAGSCAPAARWARSATRR